MRRFAILLAAAAVVVPAAARAEQAVLIGLEMGVVIGDGALIDRFDPTDTVGAQLVVARGPWSLGGGFVLFRPAPTAPAMSARGATKPDGELAALGLVVEVRRHLDDTALGAPFVGLGFSKLRLQPWDSPGPRVGGASGPRIALGLDLGGRANSRHARMSLAATYQWLLADLGGARVGGGFAGLELTLAGGIGD